MIDLAIDSRIFILTPLEEAIQELDLLLNTTNTELIGYPLFGTDFEQFLWQNNDCSSKIKDYINDKIKETYFLKNFNTDINVYMIKGQYRNIYCVKISVSDGENTQNREYQFR